MTATNVFASAIPGDSFGTNPQLSTRVGSGSKLSLFSRISEARLHTGFKDRQVIDKKRENVTIHRSEQALSTTTNLN
jgi:hypothetical protein